MRTLAASSSIRLCIRCARRSSTTATARFSATHEVLDEGGSKVDAVVFANVYDPVGVTVPLMAFKMLTVAC